jgi:hypothetical protein
MNPDQGWQLLYWPEFLSVELILAEHSTVQAVTNNARPGSARRRESIEKAPFHEEKWNIITNKLVFHP